MRAASFAAAPGKVVTGVNPLSSLLTLLIAGAAAFVLVAMYVAPGQPAMRDWYLHNACEHLDKMTPQICAPMRRADTSQRT